MAGLDLPGLMIHERYVEPDGHVFPFHTNDEFNARKAEKYAMRPWAEVQEVAIDTASLCYRLWARSGLLTPQRLEQTRPYPHYRLPIGVTLSLPCGWFLWMITLEHEGVEHVGLQVVVHLLELAGHPKQLSLRDLHIRIHGRISPRGHHATAPSPAGRA
jgi:hypothetical protein